MLEDFSWFLDAFGTDVDGRAYHEAPISTGPPSGSVIGMMIRV